MNEKLHEIFEEILNDESEAEKIMEMQDGYELYEYLKNKLPNLSLEEFESFVTDIANQYESDQKSIQSIDESELENVAGGVNFGKKFAAGMLTLASFIPGVNASNDTNNSAIPAETSISQTVSENKKDEEIGADYELLGKHSAIAKALKKAAKLPKGNIKQKYLDQALLENVKRGPFAEVHDLIAEGANINAKNEFGQNVLAVAIESFVKHATDDKWTFHMYHMIFDLIMNGANLKEAKTKDGDPIAVLFISNKFDHMLKVLLANGADVSTPSKKYKMLLMSANPDLFKLLIKQGVYLEKDWSVVLEKAITIGDIEIVKTILDRGVKVSGGAFADACSAAGKESKILDEALKHIDIKNMSPQFKAQAAVRAHYRRSIKAIRKLKELGIDVEETVKELERNKEYTKYLLGPEFYEFMMMEHMMMKHKK